jgi:hypothetical protein
VVSLRPAHLAFLGHIGGVTPGFLDVILPEPRNEIPVSAWASVRMSDWVVVPLYESDYLVLGHGLGDIVRQLQQSTEAGREASTIGDVLTTHFSPSEISQHLLISCSSQSISEYAGDALATFCAQLLIAA